MPAKINFLSQIKCVSNSLKPGKRPASPHQFATVMDSCSPQPHTCTVLVSGLLPRPHQPQRWVRFVIRKNRHLKIRSSPDVNWTSTEQGLEQRQQLHFHFIACKFCASNQQGRRFHLKAMKVQKHRAWRHFYPWTLILILVSLCVIHDQSK